MAKGVSCCNGLTQASKWDTSIQAFTCVDCGSVTSTDPSYLGSRHTRIIETPKLNNECQCGATKTYGKDATHSFYCPMWRKS